MGVNVTCSAVLMAVRMRHLVAFTAKRLQSRKCTGDETDNMNVIL
jgi:hypothetical protein